MSNDIVKIGAAQSPQSAKQAHASEHPVPAQAQKPEAAAPKAQAAAPDVQQIAKRIESYLKSVDRSLEFRVDAASGRTVVSVRDAETGDLIRQIPGEEVLRFAEMAEDQTIVLVNESA